MTELLRRLLEGYDGITPPMRVQTDLSAARTPSYAITQRGESVVGEDVLGRRSYTAVFALHIRHVAASEQDRRDTHKFLQELGGWLSAQGCMTAGSRSITAIEVNPAVLQEAYDDGTAAWSMEIRLRCNDN